MTTQEKHYTAALAFMQRLQALNINDLDHGLRAMSVEAANIFPMITDSNESESGANGAAYRDQMLQESIFRVTGNDKLPSLTLENEILITSDGRIVDGRNRVAAVLRNASELPLIDWAELAKDPEEAGIKFRQIMDTKVDAMEMLKAAGGVEGGVKLWNDADLLFRHVKVTFDEENLQFDQIMKLNMARRDMSTSQRACVAADVSNAAFKRFGGPSKPTDASIADSFGIGHKTMKRAKAVKKANRALFNDVKEGKLTIGKAEAMLKRLAAESEAEEAPEAGETKTKAPKVEKAIVYGAEAIAAGIANKKVKDIELFDAVMKGLAERFGDEAAEFTAIEGALSKLCGVDLI